MKVVIDILEKAYKKISEIRTCEGLTLLDDETKRIAATGIQNGLAIDKHKTNGDVFMMMYPGGDLHSKETEGDTWEEMHPGKVCYELKYRDFYFDEDWWYTLYE